MVILAAAGEESNPTRIIDQVYELATAYQDELQVVHGSPEAEADEHFRELRKIAKFGDIGIDVEIDRASDIAQRMRTYSQSRLHPTQRGGRLKSRGPRLPGRDSGG